MIETIKICFCVISFCIVCNGTNLEYTFDGRSFNFDSWQEGNNGFQCHRDKRYILLCKHRWDTITNELGDCGSSMPFITSANGTNTIMFSIIGFETITIGAILLYIHRKPKIVAKERAEVEKCLKSNAEISVSFLND